MYWKLLKVLKTPVILLLDLNYNNVSYDRAKYFCPHNFKYNAEIQDCDDAAWQAKANASKFNVNGFGFVIGWVTWANSLHAWNCFVNPEGKVYQLEPQTGNLVSRIDGYIPLGVII